MPRLYARVILRNTSGPLGRGRPQAWLLRHKTHYSSADSGVRIFVEPGETQDLNYLCSMAVDEGRGVISHVQADFTDRRDGTLLPSIMLPIRQRPVAHELPMREVTADTNYSNGVNDALLEAPGISPDPCVRLRRPVSTCKIAAWTSVDIASAIYQNLAWSSIVASAPSDSW